MNESLRILKELAQKSDTNTDELRTFFKEYMENPVVIPVELLPNRQILRARLNEDEHLFTKVSEISYPPLVSKTNRGRITHNNPLFYGVYVDRKWKFEKPICSAIREILPEDFNSNIGKINIATVGYWENSQNILLYSLPIPQTYNGEDHEVVRIIVDKWEQHHKDFPMEEMELVEYIGELMNSKDKKSYRLTSAFTHFIFERNPKIQGVIYPSVRSNGLNMCVALKSDVVDSFLQCHLAKMFIYTKFTPKDELIAPIAEAKANGDKTLDWESYN